MADAELLPNLGIKCWTDTLYLPKTQSGGNSACCCSNDVLVRLKDEATRRALDEWRGLP